MISIFFFPKERTAVSIPAHQEIIMQEKLVVEIDFLLGWEASIWMGAPWVIPSVYLPLLQPIVLHLNSMTL